MSADSTQYVGRFAPSPSGPLHFGSLVCALASFLDAKKNNGLWLLRIEDIDPPREDPKHVDTILNQLEHHGLHWNGPILFQSQRTTSYARALDELHRQHLTYACTCSRKRLGPMSGVYDGHCRARTATSEPHAVRLTLAKSSEQTIAVDDLIMGDYRQNLHREVGDFVLRRKDGLYSYQLASVIDDQFQGITRVVRGYDLLNSSPRQRYLQRCLNYPSLEYAHVPIAVDQKGHKLSKQTKAQALKNRLAPINLWNALDWLGQKPPKTLLKAPVMQLLEWAMRHWVLQQVSNRPARPAQQDHDYEL